MPLVAAKCTECGAAVKVDAEKKAAVCESCGNAFIIEDAINNFNTQYFTTNEIQADTVNITNVSRDGTDIEPLEKRAKMYIEGGNWRQAYEYYDKILDINPEYAPAYVGKLCVKYRLKKEDALGGRMASMVDVADYEKALRFGDDLLRARLKGYEAEIQKRMELFAELSSREHRIGQYLWRVMHIQDGKALMIAKDFVAIKPYNKIVNGNGDINDMFISTTWETCTLRKWLNETFLNSFPEPICADIMETDVIDNMNNSADSNHKGGNDTKDKIFLLNAVEIEKYFPKDRTLIVPSSGDVMWLRSVGKNHQVSTIIYTGEISHEYANRGGCVRPALWFDLQSKILSRDFDAEMLWEKEELSEKRRIEDGLGKRLKYEGSIGDKVRFGEYVWRVLAIEDTRVLLITEKIICNKQFNKHHENFWCNSLIRDWLNVEFLDSLGENANRVGLTITDGDTPDFVFLLDDLEATLYFSNDELRIACYDSDEWGIWWLRSRGSENFDTVSSVSKIGRINDYGNLVTTEYGVRPAIWLDLVYTAVPAERRAQYWERQGLCRYCGGTLGIFHKCKSCERKN
jgi:tetratricopeptide (TPR) repeat protein